MTSIPGSVCVLLSLPTCFPPVTHMPLPAFFLVTALRLDQSHLSSSQQRGPSVRLKHGRFGIVNIWWWKLARQVQYFHIKLTSGNSRLVGKYGRTRSWWPAFL